MLPGNKQHQACIGALTLKQVRTVVKLLRDHGQGAHANSMEAACAAANEIFSNEIGKRHWQEALEWADNQTERDPEPEQNTLH